MNMQRHHEPAGKEPTETSVRSSERENRQQVSTPVATRPAAGRHDNNRSQTGSTDLEVVKDLFSVGGKPLPVGLTRQTDGTWQLRMDATIPGAVAQVRMQNGVILTMTVKAEKSKTTGHEEYSIATKLSKEELTFVVSKLPTGRMAVVMLSEQRYGDRFRLVWEMRPDGRHALYMVQEPEAE